MLFNARVNLEAYVIVVRRIQQGEFPLYRSIRLESLLDSPSAFSANYEEALNRTEESWRSQCDSLALAADKCSFIAFDGDAAIGISSLYKTSSSEGDIELMQVWVSPAYRGQGVAGQIFKALEMWAKEHGFVNLFLRSKSDNAIANAYYKKIGFVIKDVSDGEYYMEKVIADLPANYVS